MLRSATLALSLALFGSVAVADEVPIPQGYASLQGMFTSMRGHHVQIVAGRDSVDVSVDTVGGDHFCGRSARSTVCMPYTSVLFVEMVKPDHDRVHVRADASPAR
ncbi:hypothetical protein [Dokdonella sp.]|uniref:hypothetical protein n=1 Tax=Dokdonella sp. TaxID=2291710 RepID=UPI0037851FFF